MIKLVLLRHGESVWNKENRFTGWTDVDLSEKGIAEAKQAAVMLKKYGLDINLAYTSMLKRAIKTLAVVLEDMDLLWIPVIKSWRLNERHYGALQGLNKAETAKKYGDEQVHIWRRSYDTRPPALEKTDTRFPGHDRRYKNLNAEDIPVTECLKDTVERFLPFYQEEIEPLLHQKRHILICAHGNSLRALVKYLDNISDEEIINLNIPTGVPLIYELDDNLKALRSYYLKD